MKETNRIKPARSAARVPKPTVGTIVAPDFQHLVDVSTTEVEQCTVPEFLNRIHFSRGAEDIIRFGSKVRAMADAFLLPFTVVTHPRLGTLRVVPVEFMQWVYTLLAGPNGWPQIIEMAALHDSEDPERQHREELRRTEGTRKNLESVAAQAPSPEISAAMSTVLAWLESESQRLRGETPPTPQPLRSI